MTSTIKIRTLGNKIKGINKDEFIKYDKNRSFSSQRSEVSKMGASEAGSLFIGEQYFVDLLVSRIFKAFGRTKYFESNLKMEIGKEVENLGFTKFASRFEEAVPEFYVDQFGDTFDENDIPVDDNYESNWEANKTKVYKNKYANGIDKYNYFKKYKNYNVDICATPDGWLEDRNRGVELIEIKYSQSYDIEKAINIYKSNGNFLENRFFFKYYIQCQVQMACTGVDTCNLYFLIGNEPQNCIIYRNEKVLDYIYEKFEEMQVAINDIVGHLKLEKDDKYFQYTGQDELVAYITSYIKEHEYYAKYKDYDYLVEFVQFSTCYKDNFESVLQAKNIDVNEFETQIQYLENIKYEITQREKTLSSDLRVLKNNFRDKVNEISAYSVYDKVYYKFKDKLLFIDKHKRSILDRFNFVSFNTQFDNAQVAISA